MAYIGDCIGQMDGDWIGEQLSDFTYTFNDADGDFVSKMNLLSETYNLTADDLISDLIAFATNHKRTCLDLPFLELYEQTVLTKKVDQSMNETLQSASHSSRAVLSERKIPFEREDSPDLDASSYVKEIEAESTLDEKYLRIAPDRSATASLAYQNRKNKGKLIASHCGKYYGRDHKKRNPERKISVEPCLPSNLIASFSRYGNEKDVNTVEEICSRIELLSEAIREGSGVASFEPVDTISSDPFVICGQVFDESGDQLHATTCSLQAADENASIVNLDLSKLASYSLFPGKVVAMKGTNESGSIFTPTEIYEPSLMDSAPLNLQEGIDSLSVWCAAGPFTSPETLSFEQLYDFIELANKESPDIIILMGPFIDRNSKAAQSPSLGRTFSELFEILLVNLFELLDKKKTNLILVPNKKDAVVLPFYPVAPFDVSRDCRKNFYEGITLLSDPAVVKIAGIGFAISNSEILQHLGRDEIHCSENSENEDRMSRLFSHLIRQRSLYPLYPPSSGVSQSIPKVIKASKLREIPHLMILSSMLAPMVKVVDSCLCINVNALARGAYAKLDINLRALGDKETSKGVEECCSVKITRL